MACCEVRLPALYIQPKTRYDYLMKKTTFDFAALEATPRATQFEQQLPDIKFYQLDWGRYVPVVKSFDPNEVTSFSKAMEDVLRAQGFWRGLTESLVG